MVRCPLLPERGMPGTFNPAALSTHRDETGATIMRMPSRLAAGFLLLACVGLFSLNTPAQPKPESGKNEAEAKLPGRVLPGLRADGFVQLPNQWALKPAG